MTPRPGAAPTRVIVIRSDRMRTSIRRTCLAAGRGLATIVGYWSDTVDALEVWNEPDIGFGNHFPAAYVTAFTKAVSRAFSERG